MTCAVGGPTRTGLCGSRVRSPHREALMRLAGTLAPPGGAHLVHRLPSRPPDFLSSILTLSLSFQKERVTMLPEPRASLRWRFTLGYHIAAPLGGQRELLRR